MTKAIFSGVVCTAARIRSPSFSRSSSSVTTTISPRVKAVTACRTRDWDTVCSPDHAARLIEAVGGQEFRIGLTELGDSQPPQDRTRGSVVRLRAFEGADAEVVRESA